MKLSEKVFVATLFIALSQSFAYFTPMSRAGPVYCKGVLTRLDNIASEVSTSDIFSLDSIRATLIRQEETIIFAMIERAQFRRNLAIYDPSHISSAYGQGTLADDKGKSISLLYPEYNIYTSAIVGGAIPIALGTALSLKLQKKYQKVFFFSYWISSLLNKIHIY